MTIKNIDPNPKTTVTNSRTDPLHSEETLDTIVGEISSGTNKNADEEWFGTDVSFDDELESGRGAECIVSFSFTGNDSKVFFTNDGTIFDGFYEGVTLKAGSRYEPPFQVEGGNLFNIKAEKAITVTRCVVTIKGKQAPQ